MRISVELPVDIVYVAGTINGTAAIWTKAGAGQWSATAPYSESKEYFLQLTLTTDKGWSYKTEFTAYYWLYLIWDRTQADVDYASALNAKDSLTDNELDEIKAGLRGSYNARDLNRVEYAVDYLRNAIEEYGYKANIQTVKTDWTDEDTPDDADFQRYLDNIAELKRVWHILPDTPPLPTTMRQLTYQKANDIEAILRDLNYLLEQYVRGALISNTFYSGVNY